MPITHTPTRPAEYVVDEDDWNREHTLPTLDELLLSACFYKMWFANNFTEVVGTGAVTLLGALAQLRTGVNINSKAAVYNYFAGIYEDNYPYWHAIPKIYLFYSSMQYWVGLSANKDIDTTAVSSMGVEVVTGSLYAFSSDGAVRSTLDLSTSISAGAYPNIMQLLTDSALKTWVDGVAKADKTTNLPTVSLPYFVAKVENLAAANRGLDIYSPTIAYRII